VSTSRSAGWLAWFRRDESPGSARDSGGISLWTTSNRFKRGLCRAKTRLLIPPGPRLFANAWHILHLDAEFFRDPRHNCEK